MGNEEKSNQYEVIQNCAIWNESHEVVSESPAENTSEYEYKPLETETNQTGITCENYIGAVNMSTEIVHNSTISDLVANGVLDKKSARSILESTHRAVEERERSVTALNLALVRKTDAEADTIRLTGEAEVEKKQEEAHRIKEEAGKIQAEAEVTRSTGKAEAGKIRADSFVSVAFALSILSLSSVFVGGAVFIGYCVLNHEASVDSLIKFCGIFILFCIVVCLRFNVLKELFGKLFGRLFGG